MSLSARTINKTPLNMITISLQNGETYLKYQSFLFLAQCKTYPYGKNHPIYPPHHPNYDASEEDDDAVDDPSPFYHNAYKPSLYFPCKSPKCFIQCSNGKPVAQKTAPGTLWCQTKKTSGKLIHKDTYNSHHCRKLA